MAITKASNGVGGRIRKVTITEINDNAVSFALYSKYLLNLKTFGFTFLKRNGTGLTPAALTRRVKRRRMC